MKSSSLYGTSYGTKVALDVRRTLPPERRSAGARLGRATDGPEAFAIRTFKAIAGVLEMCADSACAGITSNPLANIATLAAQLGKRALSGSVYDGSGTRHASTLDEQGLLDILEAGDLNPALRALLPAAVQSALRHDPDPLLRLRALSEGLIPSVPREGSVSEASQEIDEALFVTTSCEETPFPWQREASEAPDSPKRSTTCTPGRPATSTRSMRSPRTPNSLVPDCAGWPDASPPPPAASRLPNVPTLILSGEQDVRTPPPMRARLPR